MLDVREPTCCLYQIANPRSSQVISPLPHSPLLLSPPLDTVINHTDWNSISLSHQSEPGKLRELSTQATPENHGRQTKPCLLRRSTFRVPAAIWRAADCNNGCNYAFAMNTCQEVILQEQKRNDETMLTITLTGTYGPACCRAPSD